MSEGTYKYGLIVAFWPERNYGFVREDDTDVRHFFHASECPNRLGLPKGTRVRFVVGEHRGRATAQQIETYNEVAVAAKAALAGAR